MPRVSKSILTCICTAVVCAASSVTLADGRTVAVSVNDMNGAPSPDAVVAIRTIDGEMSEASSSGTIYAVKNVGEKVTLNVVHPVYGEATLEADLPMVDPVHVVVDFMGPGRAMLSQVDMTDLNKHQSRVAGWNQNAGFDSPEGGGGSCTSCTPIGEGVFAGNSCDGGSEPDNTSCTFNDTVTEWYCYTASCTGTATASTCGSGYDTALAAFDGCGGSQLACNDDTCGLQSTISWSVSAGTTYYIRVSGFNAACGSYTLDVSCEGDGGGGGCGDCNEPDPAGEPGCSDQTCQDIVCAADPFCCDVAWDGICADEANDLCDCAGGPGGGCGDCDEPDPAGLPGCSDQACQDIVCAIDPFCCDVAWDGICADEANDLCNCSGPPCQSDDDCPPGQVCVNGACVAPPCNIDCPPGALEEGEACGDDNNGGCNSAPPVFVEANCGDTYCGNSWADGGTRDTDWYLVDHGGGPISASVNSQFQSVLFVVDGIGTCSPVVVGDIGCANDCSSIADASADLPAGQYVIFVAVGNCDGSAIFEGVPCGSGDNDYVVTLNCSELVTGACCLPDNTCVDDVTQEECEAPPAPPGGCGDCNQPNPSGLPGCSDDDCEALVCSIDPFCCDVAWDGICADEANDLCNCGGGGGGLGGVYQGDDTTCPGPTCIPVGGCCQCDGEEQFCTIESEEDCAALGGQWLGDGAACEAAGGQVTVDSSPNAAIPDDNPFGVSDTINMGGSFTVLDLEVSVNISHTWVGDLCVKLSKDGGPEVSLIQRITDASLGCNADTCCGCSENNLNVTLDDEAGSSIQDQCAANLAGTYVPHESLAGYLGGDSAGAWTIRVSDNAGADLGTLNSWSLTFTQPASGGSPCEDAGHTCQIPAEIDIKPGSCPNSFNRNSNGVLPVALVGGGDIDAASVDISSLSLSRADGVGGSVSPNEGPPGPHTVIGDTATAFPGEACDCHDLEGDGIDDVNMKFNSQEVVEALELDSLLPGDLVELVLTGSLLDGTSFGGSDCIRLVPPGTPPGVLLVGSNLPGVWVDVAPLDDQLDIGGYASFNRSYPQTTVVTVTAPMVPTRHPDWELVTVWVDGVAYTPAGGVIQVAIDGDQNVVALQYRNSNNTPGVGGFRQSPGGSSTN